MIFDEAIVTDDVQDDETLERLESALTRVETAAARLRQRQQQAQARYELLDRTGSEILAAIDTVLNEPGGQQARSEPANEARGIKLASPGLAIADAA